jgi:acyl carrier protein
MDDLTQRVYEAISRATGIPLSDLRDDTVLLPGGDKLDVVELIMTVEDEVVGLTIPDAVAEHIRTAGDLVEAVLAATPVPLPGEEALQKFRPRRNRAEKRVLRKRGDERLQEAPGAESQIKESANGAVAPAPAQTTPASEPEPTTMQIVGPCLFWTVLIIVLPAIIMTLLTLHLLGVY